MSFITFKSKIIMKRIETQGIQIYTFQQNENDYISLTDIARSKNPH